METIKALIFFLLFFTIEYVICLPFAWLMVKKRILFAKNIITGCDSEEIVSELEALANKIMANIKDNDKVTITIETPKTMIKKTKNECLKINTRFSERGAYFFIAVKIFGIVIFLDLLLCCLSLM
ncbi:MAG: hypothetical protein Q4D02_06800 [Clostridia bacterium]|nr:hypothetical protein [Clostridia bacterium]